MKKRNLLLAVVAGMSISVGVTQAMNDDDPLMLYPPSSDPEHLLFRKILCTEVPLPKVIELRLELYSAGFDSFAYSEKIHPKLYGYSSEFGYYPLLPREIIKVITTCIIKFNEQIKSNQELITEGGRQKILHIIFCKAPDVQKLLRFKELGLNELNYEVPKDPEEFELGLWYKQMRAKTCGEKNAKL